MVILPTKTRKTDNNNDDFSTHGKSPTKTRNADDLLWRWIHLQRWAVHQHGTKVNLFDGLFVVWVNLSSTTGLALISRLNRYKVWPNVKLSVHLFVRVFRQLEIILSHCPTCKVWPNVKLSRWIRRGQLQAPVHEGGWSRKFWKQGQPNISLTLRENQDNLNFHENQDNYNKKIAPFNFDKVKNLNIPVNINVSMSVIDFIKIEEVDHVYILKFRLVLEWYLWDMKVRITKLCLKGTTTE